MESKVDRRNIDLTVSCYGITRGIKYEVAILPWGATEPHNLHLPYLTDSILPHCVAVEAAAMAWESEDVHCMVLPAVPFGSHNPGQRELPFCIHARQSTQMAILEDVVDSLHLQGIRRLLILGGHGGNEFKGMIRDLACKYPDFLIMCTNWFSFVPTKDYFEAEIDDHAGESETSVMMHYHPEWVDLAMAGEGHSKPFAIDALNEKVAWTPRHWHKATVDTGVGNPRKASAEKGECYLQAVVAKLARLLVEVARKDLY